MAAQKTILIIGASRGLGFALAEEFLKRGWSVVATSRQSSSSDLKALAEKNEQLEVEYVDVTKVDELRALRKKLEGRRIDIVFVNAGINVTMTPRMLEVSDDDFNRLMLTNALAPVRALELFEDLVPADGMLSVMSSVLASMTMNSEGSWPSYSASKAALNMLMHTFQHEFGGSRTVMCLHPGWVKTSMGGDDAPLTIEDVTPGLADVLTHPFGGKLIYKDYSGKDLTW